MGKPELVPRAETTHIMTPEEVRAVPGLDQDTTWQKKSDGTISELKSTDTTSTQETKNYEYYKKNFTPDAAHPAPMTFEQWNTAKQQASKGNLDKPLVGVDGKEVDPTLTGPDLIAAIPPAVARHAQAILEIRERWPSGTEQARDPQLQQALAAAQQMDRRFNQQSFATRQQMKNSAESGSGRINVANLANNTALFHSSTLADAITALNNSDNMPRLTPMLAELVESSLGRITKQTRLSNLMCPAMPSPMSWREAFTASGQLRNRR